MVTSDEVELKRSGKEEPATTEEVDLTRSDVRVLRYLADAGADYPALVAGNTGLHAPHAERRIDSMVADGLIEQVSEEVVYRITSAGREAIADD